METKQKISILGTNYEIGIDDEECIENCADGLCKIYEKRIVVRSKEKLLDPDSTEESKLERMKEVVRHEIIHAYFEEAGLCDYSKNEELVSWIAIQFPKMLQSFKETNSI